MLSSQLTMKYEGDEQKTEQCGASEQAVFIARNRTKRCLWLYFGASRNNNGPFGGPCLSDSSDNVGGLNVEASDDEDKCDYIFC